MNESTNPKYEATYALFLEYIRFLAPDYNNSSIILNESMRMRMKAKNVMLLSSEMIEVLATPPSCGLLEKYALGLVENSCSMDICSLL